MSNKAAAGLFSQGRDALRAGRLDEARELIVQALALAPDNSAWHATLANVCLKTGDLAAALTSMERAVHLSPTSARHAYALGNLLLRTDDVTRAEKSLRRAVELDPFFVAAWADLGRALESMGEFGLAEKNYIRALELEPDQPTALTGLALAAERRGDLATGLRHRARLAELKANSASAQRAEANLRMQVGDYAGALAAYRRLAALNPHHSPTAAVIVELEKWLNSGQHGKTEASAAYYDAVYASSKEYAVDGKDIEHADHWAWVCEQLHRHKINSVVDIGCGPGQFAQYLRQELDAPYLGIDFSSTAIKQARSRGVKNAEFFVGDVVAETFPKIPPNTAIICTEVLEHTIEDLKLIRKFPPKRLCLCSVPNFHTFGHVRYFRDEAAVEERYRPFFDDFNVKRLQLARGRNALYVFSGWVKCTSISS